METWRALAPAVLSLAGVALGAVGSLLAQHLASRSNAREVEAERRAAHRAELRASIMRLLGSAHRAERAIADAAERGAVARARDDQSVVAVLHELWLAQQELDLVAISEPLRGVAFRYTRAIADTADRELAATGDDADDLLDLRIAFMDAARLDLWPGCSPVRETVDKEPMARRRWWR
jgi:hypothetical protein